MDSLAVKETDQRVYPKSLESFFESKTQQMFLIQLPDTLPGQGNDDTPLKDEDSNGTRNVPANKVSNVCI